MPQQVTDIDILRDYLQGAMGKADHHAGGVVWRKDDDPIEVMVREGEMKNVLWFKVDGNRYAISYNHDTKEIEIRQGSTQGAVMGSFSNSMTNNQVRQVFESL